MSDLPLRCRCGAIEGTLAEFDPRRGLHLVCMCDDCQTYAHWLGHADTILDAAGGTEVVQTWPARVTIQKGRDSIHCMRLSPKGLLRFHASCCRTPLFNMIAKPKLAFIGVARNFVAVEHSEADRLLGPIRARVQSRYGKPPLLPKSHARAPLGIIIRAIRLLWTGRRGGLHMPSPVRDEAGRPFVPTTVLTREERARAKAQAGVASDAN